MFPKLDDKTLKDGPRTLGDAETSLQRISQRSRLATFGIGAGVAASLVVALGGPAKAGDNPPPGLLAKIQIATQAMHRTPTFSKVRTTPRIAFRRVVRSR